MSLLIRALILSGKGSIFMTSSNLNYHLKALFPNVVILEFKASIYELEGGQIQPMAAAIPRDPQECCLAGSRGLELRPSSLVPKTQSMD